MSAFSLLQLAHNATSFRSPSIPRSEAGSERTDESDPYSGFPRLPPFGAMGPMGSSAPLSASGIYSSTGFDLLRVLSKLVSRPNPVVDVGPVDFSCSFLVTDVRKPDMPIVYVSETFTKLTGYAEHELLGRNCRFLQAPDGKVEPGSFRRYCDNSVIHSIKESIKRREECQYTAINYKKTGEPFINLMTLIPLEYDKPGETAFYIGLQVDLVDQPKSILNRMKDGTYTVNYQIAEHLSSRPQLDNLADFNEEVTDLIAPAHSPNPRDITPELPGVMHNFLETYSDFVHILSLRGLFLYAAPSATQRLLEYCAEDLMGHPLSEFVHPADLVAVMRELRSATPEDSINIMCRFRRKHSGYMYMEITGHMYEGEVGKRTKCFVLTGRERKVPTLPIKDVLLPKRQSAETWAKLSPQGLILFICPNSGELFGNHQDDMYAHSILEFVSESDHQAIQNALRRVATERIVQNVRCQILNKRNHVPVLFRLYNDGDSMARTIICQIRLLEGSDADEPVTLREYEELFDAGNLFDVMGEVRVTSLHYELNQLRIHNKRLRGELETLTAPPKKKSKSRALDGPQECAQCHTTYSPEWRKGPDNQRNLCNACGLRFAKQTRKTAS